MYAKLHNCACEFRATPLYRSLISSRTWQFLSRRAVMAHSIFGVRKRLQRCRVDEKWCVRRILPSIEFRLQEWGLFSWLFHWRVAVLKQYQMKMSKNKNLITLIFLNIRIFRWFYTKYQDSIRIIFQIQLNQVYQDSEETKKNFSQSIVVARRYTAA